MKRFGYLLLIIVAIIAFFVFGLKSIFSENRKHRLVDTDEFTKPVKEPLEIEPVIQEYDSIISSEIKLSGTVGAAVVITYKDQIAFLKCYGVKKAGTKDSINANTIFRLASVSKTISGVLSGILSENKLINLDDKVVDYLPEFRLKSEESTENITIRNLLSHTSGLISHAFDNLVEEKVPIQDIIANLNQVEISAPPGKLYAYQNVMFSLFDTVLVKKLHKPFGSIMKEYLFTPLGMNDASTDFKSFKNNPNKAFPHVGANGKYRVLRLNDRYYNTAPAAGVNASISDMGNFLLHLTSNDSTALNSEIQKTVFTPQVVSPLKRSYLSHWDRVDSKEYALGWRIIGYKGRTVAYHGGYVSGYKTEVAYCSDEKIGIAFLSNSPNSVASESVPVLLNLLFKFSDNKKTLTQNFETNKTDQNL